MFCYEGALSLSFLSLSKRWHPQWFSQWERAGFEPESTLSLQPATNYPPQHLICGNVILKGLCHEIVSLFILKSRPGYLINRLKPLPKCFRFWEDICEKVVSAKSLTTRPRCPQSHRISGWDIFVIKNIDTVRQWKRTKQLLEHLRKYKDQQSRDTIPFSKKVKCASVYGFDSHAPPPPPAK